MNFRKYNIHDVDTYIAHAEPEARPMLTALRSLVKMTVPDAEEYIKWGVPFYMHHGMLAGFAPMKNHVSFGLVTVLDVSVRKELEEQGYKTGKKTVQIRYDQPVPAKLIQRILKTQARMNESSVRN